jgi:nucleoside-diphosphate-sugar epimerase
MDAVVTGAAGFIGSHLCAYLLDNGDEVVGVDCFTDAYDLRRKEANFARLSGREGFTQQRLDLTSAPLSALFDHADVVYHLAGQSCVRGSWGDQFAAYLSRNVLSTHRVLEAAQAASLWKVVYASSFAVYGAAERLPTAEDLPARPISPFGVTTLAAENLCDLYREILGVSTVSLRLFTVYGPRQRPDMAMHRLVESAVRQEPFLLYGDGEQTRDFTYVDDVVRALRQAALSPWTGTANIGSGSPTTMNEAIEALSELTGPIEVVRLPAQRGDVRHAVADTSKARRGFGYTAHVPLREGLERMVDARSDLFAVGPSISRRAMPPP